MSNDGFSISEIIEISEKAVSAGDFVRAIRLYSAWIDMNQSDEMLFLAHFYLGIAYRKNYQFDLAASSFENSFDLNKEFMNSYILMQYCKIMATTNDTPTGGASQAPACSQDKLFKDIIKLRRK
ncbi:tetratricopeptide repeat protein [Paramagnetospirillum magnetotacticum]|uniref:tetratricopeptide repeat protein n=1 Tax=Paramagnetospirillum magnetotacticum TaxID=188 RepID=UPI0005976E41|nr:tetratricopeptide repeat protein [Paramagnetospirillum magnetotacticum]